LAKWVRVASVDELKQQNPLLVVLDDEDIALYRVKDQYFATDDLCSHAEASLSEGDLKGFLIHCPRHGGQFDVRTGAARHFPAYTPIRTFPVKAEGNEIFIEIEQD